MRTFEDIERNALELKLTFFRTLFDWMTAIELFSFISFLEFFLSLFYSIVILWFLSTRLVYFGTLLDQ
jgi:hypothetical protein